MTRSLLLSSLGGLLATGSFLAFASGALAQESSDEAAPVAGLPANAMTVSPLRLDVTAAKSAETVRINNPSASPMAVQVRLFAWSQKDGQETYAPSTDLLIAPSIVTIPGGQTQVVRVVRKGTATPGQKTYRLIVDQLPDPAMARAGAALTRVRFALPVFVDTDKAAPAKLDWSVADGGIRVANSGGAAARITRIEVTSAGGKPVQVENNSLRYVFGSDAITWPLGKACSFANLTVTAHIDGQAVDARPVAHCG